MANDIVNYQDVITDIKGIILSGREVAYNAANKAMVLTYWHVGKRIVEQEQAGKERAKYTYNFKTMLDEGVIASNGSDSPVELPDVMKGIQCAVTRKSLDGKYGPFLPEQALSVEEAIKTYTILGAYGSFEENVKGSIEAGKVADFVVLGQNPFEVDPSTLKDVPVLATYLDGECVFSK